MNPILQDVLETVLTIAAGAIATQVTLQLPRAIAAFEAWTHIKLTDQQVAVLSAAAQTGANALTGKIRAGLLPVAPLSADHPAVLEQADAALARVPDAAAGQKMSVQAMAEVIAARVQPLPANFPVTGMPPVTTFVRSAG